MSEPEFTEILGFRNLGMQGGAFVIELPLEPRHLSRAARAHGGILFSLLDTALGRAVLAELPEGRGCATVEIKINYFRPVQHGVLRASGRCVQKTRSLAYAEGDRVAMNVGFYYMANAGGRLLGTILSGVLYQWQGLEACLWASAVFVLTAALLSRLLPTEGTAAVAVAR